MDKIKKVFSSHSKHGDANVEHASHPAQDLSSAPPSAPVVGSERATTSGLETDVPHPTTTGTTAGMSSILPDRTAATDNSAIPTQSPGQHPTFTGEKLDPEDNANADNIQSYHEHKLNAGVTSTATAAEGGLSHGSGSAVDSSDTGPASKTIGPHTSNVANVVDPRVKPEPEKMKGHDSAHAHQSAETIPHGSHATGDSQRKGSLLGFLHGGDPKTQEKYDDGNNALTAREKYYGTAGAGAGTTNAAAVPTSHETQAPHSTTAHQESGLPPRSSEGTRVVGGNGYSSYETSMPATTSTTDAHAAPAHATFVKPGYNHEHHVGLDGPIGRESEVSGLTTDARHTVDVSGVPSELASSGFKPQPTEPDLRERQASLPAGTVIEPRTGLPMNVAKYGSGEGGTDASPQVHGFDENTHRERLGSIADERSRTAGVPTWEAIKENN